MVTRSTSWMHSAADAADVDPRIPVTLVTGGARAAKAALLDRMAGRGSRGTIYAFSIMDPRLWRSLSKDAETVAGAPGIVRLPSGHICCYAGDDPVAALYQLHLRKLGLLAPQFAYDAVLFEVGHDVETGSFVAVVQNDTRLDLTYRIAQVLHVVDPSAWPFRRDEKQSRWIGEADTIVLGAPESGDAGGLRAARAAVLSLNPLAAIRTMDDVIGAMARPASLASQRMSNGDAAELARETGMVRLDEPEFCLSALASNFHNDARINAPSDQPPLRSLRLRIGGEVDVAAVLQAIKHLCCDYGRNLLRLSAVLNVRHAEHPVALDVIGGTLLHPSYCSGQLREESEICVVVRGLDIAWLLNAAKRFGRRSTDTQARMEAAI